MALAMRAGSEPRPNLEAVTTPALSAALQDEDHLWAFLTAPDTPYLERRAASVQGRKVFSVAPGRPGLGRLTSAIAELRAEALLSNLGVEVSPLDSRGRLGQPPDSRQGVMLLGHPWTVPAPALEYPLTWDEEARAPWPWQVQQSLMALFGQLLPHSTSAAEVWLSACMTLPWDTEDRAAQYLDATEGSSHWKSPAVLARWRAIALAPALPLAATRAAGAVARATRLWDVRASAAIGQVVTLDILRLSPHTPAREAAAYGLRELSRRWHDGSEETLPSPATAILVALKAAEDPKNGDAWKRLYVYGFSALEAMAAPPFPPDRRMDPAGKEPQARLDQLASWRRANESRLETDAAREGPRLDAARALLDAADAP
jgi:hypothetical protein